MGICTVLLAYGEGGIVQWWVYSITCRWWGWNSWRCPGRSGQQRPVCSWSGGTWCSVAPQRNQIPAQCRGNDSKQCGLDIICNQPQICACDSCECVHPLSEVISFCQQQNTNSVRSWKKLTMPYLSIAIHKLMYTFHGYCRSGQQIIVSASCFQAASQGKWFKTVRFGLNLYSATKMCTWCCFIWSHKYSVFIAQQQNTILRK